MPPTVLEVPGLSVAVAVSCPPVATAIRVGHRRPADDAIVFEGLLTFKRIVVDVFVTPELVRIRALIRCTPPVKAAAVSTETAYGLVLSSGPIGRPSARNCTPATPSGAVADAVSDVAPLMVAPPVGAGTETVAPAPPTVIVPPVLLKVVGMPFIVTLVTEGA